AASSPATGALSRPTRSPRSTRPVASSAFESPAKPSAASSKSPSGTTTSCGQVTQLAVGRQLDPAAAEHAGPVSDSDAFSENGQVLIELPGRELDPVLVPLASLELDVTVE